MKLTSAWITVLIGIVAIRSVESNGYYGGDESGQTKPTSNTNQPAQSLPQYDSSPPAQDDLWWLKSNPFQKPANHPGVERGDTKTPQSQPAPKPYVPSYNNQPSNSGSFSNQQTSFQNTQIPESPECLLRNKADCHAASPANVQQTGFNQQQAQQLPGYPDSDSVTNNFNTPNKVPVPETAYVPPKYNTDPYSSGRPVAQPHGPTPPPIPYQRPNTGVAPEPIVSNYQQSQGSYEPKPYTGYNNQYNSNSQYQQTAPVRRPQTNSYNPPAPGSNNFEDQPPYPGCPAAMLCVPEDYCNSTGFNVERPAALSPAEKLFRVALMACSKPETGEVGVCCRDPNYKDPWPDMGAGHQHHPKDSSGSHVHHNDGQYHPSQNNGQYQPQNNAGQYSSGSYQPNPIAPSNPQAQVAQNTIPQGGGRPTDTTCRPSY